MQVCINSAVRKERISEVSSLLMCLRWQSDLQENLGVSSGILPAKSYSQKKKNLTDLPRSATRTEAHYCNNSDACWLLQVTDIPARHSQSSWPPCNVAEQTHSVTDTLRTVFQSLFSLGILWKTFVQLAYFLLHSNNFIHCYQLDTSWALKLHSLWGHFK